MPQTKNKVKFNICNVHYAKITRDDNGNVTIPGQAGQTYDVILWLKGYEPVVVKNVTCPANIGTQQSSGKNETLREIFEDHRR